MYPFRTPLNGKEPHRGDNDRSRELLPRPRPGRDAGRHPGPHAGGAGKGRLHPEHLPAARPPPGRVPRLPRLPRRADGQARGADRRRARNDRGRHQQRQPVPVLRGGARRDPPHPRQGPDGLRAGRRQLAQGRQRHAASRRPCSPSPSRSPRRRTWCRKPDRQALRDAGFDEEEIWDIAAIAAFFSMSNRLANATELRPNREFHAMGRG